MLYIGACPTGDRSVFDVISTEANGASRKRSGEIPHGSLPTMPLLIHSRPYLSAQPTVGRFALGPPHNVMPRKKIKVPFTYYRIRSREISRLTPPDDETMYRYALFAGGRGRPPLPRSTKVSSGVADLPARAPRPTAARRRADEASAPTTLYQSKCGQCQHQTSRTPSPLRHLDRSERCKP